MNNSLNDSADELNHTSSTDVVDLENKLQKQLDNAELINTISRQFSKILPNEIDESINFTLSSIGNHIDIDRCYIVLFSKDKQTLTCTHEWNVTNNNTLSTTLVDFSANSWPALFQALHEPIESIYIRDIEELPPTWQVEKAFWRKHDVRAKLIVPLTCQDNVLGFISFDAITRQKVWSESDIILLSQTSSQFIAQALIRKSLYEKEQINKALLEDSLKEKEVMLREIYHRVKNNMQIIASLLRLQSNKLTDTVALEIISESQSRIQAMTLVHEKLYQSNDLAKIDARGYIADLTKSLAISYEQQQKVELKLAIDEAMIDIDQVIPLGLIINECILNSLKHAFDSNMKQPEIAINFRITEHSACELSILDNGSGLPDCLDTATSTTLGMSLIRSLTKQLGGSVNFNSQNGTEVAITFSLKE